MVKSVTLCSTLATGIFAGLTAMWSAPAAADPVADFYRGKTITSIQVFGSGGLYGLYNRLMARYMEKYVPGNPTIIVQEMKGGGGLKGANYLYNAAPDPCLTAEERYLSWAVKQGSGGIPGHAPQGC